MARTGWQQRPIVTAWEWQALGRCRGQHNNQHFHPDDDLGRISRQRREEAARQVCAACPVRAECATQALLIGEEYGVWGGLTERDRYLLRKVGWRDMVPSGQLVDIAALERRLAVARSETPPLAVAASSPAGAR